MLERFERYPLTFGPSPIEPLHRLSQHLGGGVEIYAKREDCNSGLAFGGNKIRKLEYIVPEAIAAKADTLVTIGGVQSNHTARSPQSRQSSECAAALSKNRGCPCMTPSMTGSATSDEPGDGSRYRTGGRGL